MSTPTRPTARRRATRRRIAEAGARLFVEHGYTAATMQAIADEAGVHVQTIYQAFGTKVAVLAEAAAILVAGPDEDPDTPPPERAWVKELFAEPDPARQLALYAHHMRGVAERYMRLVDIMRVTTAADPEVGEFLAHAERGRYDGPRHITTLLGEQGALRRGLGAERAADIMYAVSTYDVYRCLIEERGWTGDDTEAFVARTLTSLLLDDPEDDAPS